MENRIWRLLTGEAETSEKPKEEEAFDVAEE